jgi:small subunit ribosomal protein S15
MASYGADTKEDLIKKYRLQDNDTGSVELQISLLTKRIDTLVEHLKANKKDSATRSGLLALVGRRKRFIKYLGKSNPESLKALSKKLKLKIK